MTDFRKRDEYVAPTQSKVSAEDNFKRLEEKRLKFFRFSTEQAKRNTAFLKTSKQASQIPPKPPLKFKGFSK